MHHLLPVALRCLVCQPAEPHPSARPLSLGSGLPPAEGGDVLEQADRTVRAIFGTAAAPAGGGGGRAGGFRVQAACAAAAAGGAGLEALQAVNGQVEAAQDLARRRCWVPALLRHAVLRCQPHRYALFTFRTLACRPQRVATCWSGPTAACAQSLAEALSGHDSQQLASQHLQRLP